MGLAFGIVILVMAMAVVMGVPYAYYLKRDARYARSEGQPDEARLNIWYGRDCV